MRWLHKLRFCDPVRVSAIGLICVVLAGVGVVGPKGAHAEGIISGYGRLIQFAGYEWRIKTSNVLVGPGPNYFSDGPTSVWTDDLGRLHLQIVQDGTGHWQAAEVVLQSASLGYGSYRFVIEPLSRPLDPNVVLGLFTWNDDPFENHRELDIELGSWGQLDAPDGRYSVQPYSSPNHTFTFDHPKGSCQIAQGFRWQPGSVSFASWACADTNPPGGDTLIAQHVFTDGVPEPGGEQVRMNVWLDGGSPPTDGRSAEVIVDGFQFTPDPAPGGVRSVPDDHTCSRGR